MAAVSPSVPALITGASSGIGAEFARQLAARGHDLVVVARRRARLAALRDELEAAHGVTVTPLVADLETTAGVNRVAERLRGRGPWLLVSNAGFGTRGHLAELAVERELSEVMVNTVAMHRLCCEAFQVNVAEGSGGIIVVASMAGFQPLPYMATYAATKAFMLHFTEAMAVEARDTGVRVMALCPGPVRTEFFEGVSVDGSEPGLSQFTIAVDRCVRDALRAFDRGRTICVPGRLTHAGTLLVPHVPRALMRAAAGHVMRTARMDRADPPAR